MKSKTGGRRIRLHRPMLVAMSLPLALASVQGQAAEGDSEQEGLHEVVVTATRRSESALKVPVSIAAFSQQQLDNQGLKEIDDLTRYTPGLRLTRTTNGGNNISIRGISSGAGAGTTGVYIDDTPIQVRNLAYAAGSTFPALFDLERVEVLRGPQGTLFGSGSEGGTVRFIQTSPSLNDYSGYARGEVSTTQGGDPSYEGGAAFGGPIIEGKLGFRVSGFYRKEGGYVDGISGTPVVLDPTGNAGPASLTFTNKQVTRENTNSVEITGFRGALKFALTDAIDITPSVTYQKTERNDGFDTFWPAASNGTSHAPGVRCRQSGDELRDLEVECPQPRRRAGRVHAARLVGELEPRPRAARLQHVVLRSRLGAVDGLLAVLPLVLRRLDLSSAGRQGVIAVPELAEQFRAGSASAVD